MKKEEAKEISIERSNLIIEYINQIMSDTDKVNARINISTAKINKERNATFDIYVKENKFERHLNTGIDSQHLLILEEQIVKDIVNNYIESEEILLSRWAYVRGGPMGEKDFNGVEISNSIGSKLKLNFEFGNSKLSEIFYNSIDEYEKNKNKKRK